MNITKYLGTLDQLLQRNRLLGVALMVMLAINILNCTVLFRARASTLVTLVPISGGSGMWVGNGKASDEYLRAMARYVTGQLGNYDAGTYRKQLEELLLLFPPDTVGAVHGEFMHLADEIERYPSISSYVQWLGDQPLKIQDGKIMQIRVLKRRLVNGSVTETQSGYYCIAFRIDDTQFHIEHIEEVPGTADDLCLNPPNNPPKETPPSATVPARTQMPGAPK